MENKYTAENDTWTCPDVPRDCTVLRPVDGYEIALVGCWLSARCVLGGDHDADAVLDALAAGLPAAQQRHFPLRLALRTNAAGAPFFVWAHPESLAPDAVLSRGVWPDTAPPDLAALPGVDARAPHEALYRVRVCACPDAPRTVALRLEMNHVLCDGRTVFDVLGLFCALAEGRADPVPPAPRLPAFGHADWFAPELVARAAGPMPASWTRIPRGRLVAASFPEPAVYRNTVWRCAYAPVRAWCRAHGATVQAVLMALKTRAFRAYSGLAPATPLAVYAPTDTRALPGATALNRASPFFCHAGCSVPLVVGKGGALVRDIEHCAAAWAAALAPDAPSRTDACGQVLRSARCVDPHTLRFTPDADSPSPFAMHCVAASSIGDAARTLPGARDVLLGVSYPCTPAFYSLNVYAWHTDDELAVLMMHPSTYDPRFVDAFAAEFHDFVKLVGA